MARKTIRLETLVAEVNRLNAESTCSAEVRSGRNSFIEDILMKANAYSGFGFLTANDLKGPAVGQPPGLIPNRFSTGDHDFPDETRRMYYSSHLYSSK